MWSMNQFVWTELFPKGLKSKREALSMIAADTTGGYFPNSFCLHLVVVTADGKVVMNRISGNKSNDYPYTLAATVGEQIELSDFNAGTDYNNRFVDRWIKRAFYEEFGMPEDPFDRVVDADSARVLAFVEEGDIYNVSMVTVITLNYSAEDFSRYLAAALILDKEFDSLVFLDVKRIPEELSRHFRMFPGCATGFTFAFLWHMSFQGGIQKGSGQERAVLKCYKVIQTICLSVSEAETSVLLRARSWPCITTSPSE